MSVKSRRLVGVVEVEVAAGLTNSPRPSRADSQPTALSRKVSSTDNRQQLSPVYSTGDEGCFKTHKHEVDL